jgi:Terminase RNaseH-like domain
MAKLLFPSVLGDAPSNIAGMSLVTKRSKKANLTPDLNPYKVPSAAIDFIRSCRIRTGVGFQRFDLYDYQIELLKLVEEHSMVIVLKDRQLGATEVLAAYAYYKSLTDPAYSAAFVSINQKKSSEVSKRIDGMAPNDWNIRWAENNASTLHPEKCGIMRFLTSTKNAARGFPSVNMLVYDEAGFLEYFNELYGNGTSAQESVPVDRRKVILNTTVPEEGVAHPFWGMFASDNDFQCLDHIRSAREGGTNCDIPGMFHWIDRSGCCKVIIGHKVHPVYGKDPDYIESVKSRRKIPDSIAQREHNLGIESVGNSLFNSIAIDTQAIGQWQPPILGRKYFIMVDPNFGGSDNFISQVWDITDPVISLVAEYAEANRSIEYSEDKTIALADLYKANAMAIESNSGGKIVVEHIQKKRPLIKVLTTLTTQSTKRTNTDRVALGVEQGQIIYPSDWGGIAEMRSFSASKREAISGEKDDRVMALAAGLAHLDDVVNTSEGLNLSKIGRC